MEAPYVILLCWMACFVGFGLYQKRLEEARGKTQEDRKNLLKLLAPQSAENPSETPETSAPTKASKRSKASKPSSATVLHHGPAGSLPGEEGQAKASQSEDIVLEVDPHWSTSKDRGNARIDQDELIEVDTGWIAGDHPTEVMTPR